MKRNMTCVLLLLVLLSALLLPAYGAQLSHVTDTAGLLTEQQCQELESYCAEITARYGCGVYIATVDDHRDYGSDDVFTVTYELYHDNQLGVGSERDGLILLLSMAQRDYALFVYGDGAEYAFDTYGQICLEEAFLPELGENDWYGGFTAYAQTCEEYLALAAEGNPVRENPTFAIVMLTGVSFAVALVVVLILRSGMKNVHRQTAAAAYVSGALKLTGKFDRFTHKTTTRTKIESSSSGSSSARSGGGGSGRSGKF